MTRLCLSRRKLIAGAALLATQKITTAEARFEGPTGFPAHKPIGCGLGIHPGRVVWAHDPLAVSWDGTGYWWELEHFNAPVIARMLEKAVCKLVGDNVPIDEAWQALFSDFNKRCGRVGGFKLGEKIAVKVNMNGAGAYNDKAAGFTEESYGNAVLMRELAYSLVKHLGVRAGDITFYDAGRIFPHYLMQYVSSSSLKDVQFRHRAPGTALDVAADYSSPINWSGAVFGDKSFIPQCVVQADYLINLANLKGHCYGMTLCGKNHFGSFVNSDRMRAPQAAGLHGNVAGADYGDYSVLTDLMAHKELGGKTVLCILDGLLTAVGESVALTAHEARWSMPPFNGGFCASLFASQDPVAIDSVGGDFLINEPNMTQSNIVLREHLAEENYLHEAALIPKVPSGTRYTDGSRALVVPLGVHEHWDSVKTKRYSRNLGKKEGIELISV